jgi:phytoene dehydrogenase-like protein
LREVDLRLHGFGHSIPALLASDRMAQMCLGGSARLAKALVADIQQHGGTVRTSAEPRSILVRGGRACGVELATGERIETTGFVASGLNPQQTFLQLLDADAVSPSLRDQAKNFQYNLLAPLFALNLALREPPRYAAAERDPALDRAFMVILGLERFTQFHDIVAAHERGQIPETVMWGACPTLFDPSQAPANGHTAFMWEKLPFAVHGDSQNWDRLAKTHADRLLKRWTEYAPNLADAVVDAFPRTPLDTQRSLPNMQSGDLLVGSFANGQVGENRPFAGAGRYRTPIGRLYLCGGSTHPGGNVTGLCGYNAARVIASDFGFPIWWNPPDAEQALRSLG